MGNYIENLALLLMIKLGYHLIILSQLWIKKYKIIIYMINDTIVFWLGYYIYIKAFLSIILDELISLMEITLANTIQDIIPNKRIKKCL